MQEFLHHFTHLVQITAVTFNIRRCLLLLYDTIIGLGSNMNYGYIFSFFSEWNGNNLLVFNNTAMLQIRDRKCIFPLISISGC